MTQQHISVLLNESIEGLQIKPDGIYVDGTIGRAGHAKEILSRLTTGWLYGFDKDSTAIEESNRILSEVGRNYELINKDFSFLKEELMSRNVEKIDGLLLDLGVSSPQFDNPERGFSYRFDAPLDMRMDQTQQLNAYDVVNLYSEQDLIRILYEYGEERLSKLIVKKMIAARNKAPIETTFQLVDIIKAALPAKVLSQKGHPAKKVFQAIRIEVNDELGALRKVLHDAVDLLNSKGRICIITFHSLEDRIVKQAFNELIQIDDLDRRIPIRPEDIKKSLYEWVNRKPITASNEEIEANSRARSAKLRILRKK